LAIPPCRPPDDDLIGTRSRWMIDMPVASRQELSAEKFSIAIVTKSN
jgi:hypothetical protein